MNRLEREYGPQFSPIDDFELKGEILLATSRADLNRLRLAVIRSSDVSLGALWARRFANIKDETK